MTYITINSQTIPANIVGSIRDKSWNERESKSITVSMTYEEAKDLFVDDVEWAIVYQEDSYTDENGETVTPDPITYDNSDFSIAGPITDNRDGTITIKMGKYTENELTELRLEAAYAALEAAKSEGSTEGTVTEIELAEAYTKGVNSI